MSAFDPNRSYYGTDLAAAGALFSGLTAVPWYGAVLTFPDGESWISSREWQAITRRLDAATAGTWSRVPFVYSADLTQLRQQQKDDEEAARRAAEASARRNAQQRNVARQRAFEGAYNRAMAGWSIDQETQILVLLLPGQNWHGETGPKLVPGPRRKAWEVSEGPIPSQFIPGGVFVQTTDPYTGQQTWAIRQHPTLATWGVILVNAGKGWRPPAWHEIYPFVGLGQVVADDQARSEAVGERITRNRAEIAGVQLGIAGKRTEEGGHGGYLKKGIQTGKGLQANP